MKPDFETGHRQLCAAQCNGASWRRAFRWLRSNDSWIREGHQGGGKKMRLISWNIARREEPWHLLATEERIDVALLQEATAPPAGLRLDVVAGDEWRLVGWQDRKFSTAVVRCSSRVEVVADLRNAVDGCILHLGEGRCLRHPDVVDYATAA